MGSMLSMQWPAAARQRRQAGPWPVLLVIAGALHEWRGRFSVLRGILLHNDIIRAAGHRQQLVGMLQRLWRRDRASVEAWVDSLLRRGVMTPRPVRSSWRRTSAPAPMHLEK